jgi:tetratricopeptide (TPR) repeat protein
VRKSGEQVRITAQLIEVSDGSHIWSETYDRMLTDIFVVQDDVAAAIIEALQIHVSAAPVRGNPTENLEAYGLFLKSRVLLDAQNGREAIQLLLQATELDPNFAEGVELLAFAYWQQGGSSLSLTESQRLTNEAAAKALAISADLTFAQALYLLTDSEDRNVSRAIDLLQQALRKQPNNSAMLRTLFYELTENGYLQEAHRFALQFVEREPLSPVANYSLGESLVSLGRTSEAIAPLRVAFDLDNAFAQWFLPMFYLFTGRDERAIAIYETKLQSAGISDTAWVRDLVTDARNPLMGAAYLQRRIPHVLASVPGEVASGWQFDLRVWYLVFGFLDQYYDEIFSEGPNNKFWADADVFFWLGTIFRSGGFTAHPRYLEAARLLGITDVWEVRGPPDFCEKVDNKWDCE